MDKVLFANSIAICRQCQIACAFTLGQEAVQNMVVLWRFANYEDKTRNYRKLPPVFSRVQHGPRLNPNWLYPTTAPWQHLEITANDHCRLQYQWSIQLSLNTTNNNRKNEVIVQLHKHKRTFVYVFRWIFIMLENWSNTASSPNWQHV